MLRTNSSLLDAETFPRDLIEFQPTRSPPRASRKPRLKAHPEPGNLAPGNLDRSTTASPSPLLNLPAELRNQIYACVFTTSRLLICRPCAACDHFHVLSSPLKKRCQHAHYPRSNLSLLACCRQVHTEAEFLPFALNTFTGYPKSFSSLIQNIGGDQLCAIRRIRVLVDPHDVELVVESRYWWAKADVQKCERMVPGLRRLELALTGGRREWEDWGEVLGVYLEMWKRWRGREGVEVVLLRDG